MSSKKRGITMSLLRFLAIVLCAVVALAAAQSPAEVRKEIEAAYVKALDATRQAKSMDDLDEIDRTFNTRDWQSISPGQPPGRGRISGSIHLRAAGLRFSPRTAYRYV